MTLLTIFNTVVSIVAGVIGVIAFLRTLPRAVSWRIVPIGRNAFALVNDGRKTARRVRVVNEGTGVAITSHGTETFDVISGGSRRFTIAEPNPWVGETWQLMLTWDGQRNPVPVTLPPNHPQSAVRDPW